jgi:hypothetical protein
MRDPIPQSRRLQLALKITAICCGCILLLASAHSESAVLSLDTFLKFAASQFQSTTQLQWLFGAIFLSSGILFIPTKASKPRSFNGPKELSNDSYVLYLVDQYQIEKNLVLDQLIVGNKIFSNIDDALAFVHQIECPPETNAPLGNIEAQDVSENPVEEKKSKSAHQIKSTSGVSRKPFLNTQSSSLSVDTENWDEAKRTRVIIMVGAILFSTVLGGLYYANSHSFRALPEPVAATKPVASVPETPNSDQVVSGSIPSAQVSSVAEVKEPSKTQVATPINDRWVGLWVADGGAKQKLVVSANLLKFNDEEFTWVGTRPKGIVQCCLAFYEGATTKADLLARISGAQDPITLKPEAQKTLALVNGLSEGNFKRIVFADPYLKKYFFVYDQNHVYRISRDLGDRADVVVELFKKQE